MLRFPGEWSGYGEWCVERGGGEGIFVSRLLVGWCYTSSAQAPIY